MTPELRQKILDDYAAGTVKQIALAVRYGVAQSTISNIISGFYAGGPDKPHPFDAEVKSALDVAREQQMRVDGYSRGAIGVLHIAYKSHGDAVRVRRFPMAWDQYVKAVTYWEKTGKREKKRSKAAA